MERPENSVPAAGMKIQLANKVYGAMARQTCTPTDDSIHPNVYVIDTILEGINEGRILYQLCIVFDIGQQLT